MRQLKIVEKNVYIGSIEEHASSNVILSSNEFNLSMGVNFHLIDKDNLKFIILHEAKDYKYEYTFNYSETINIVKEILCKLKENFISLDIVISEDDLNTISEMILNIINICKSMNGIHIKEYYFYGEDASFSILGNELGNDDYFCVEIINHKWERDNLKEWMFNMEHSDKRMIMNAYAEYSKESVIWYISNNSDNVEYTDLIDYLLENFTDLSIQSDKSIIIDLD